MRKHAARIGTMLFIILLLPYFTSPAVTAEPDHDVIIVGAGISGLTAAYYLKDKNIKVLEKSDRAGGRTRTGKYKKFHYAQGTEYLGYPKPDLMQIINECNISLKEIPSPMDASYHDGKFWYGEDGIAVMLIEKSNVETYNRFAKTVLSLFSSYKDIPDFDLNSSLAKLDDITARQWFEQEKFPKIYQEKYNVASKGLFGATIDEISALSYLSEIAFDYEGFEPLEDEEDVENSYEEAKKERSESYTFTAGITEVTEGIAKKLGDKLLLNSEVTGIEKEGETYVVHTKDSNGESHRLTSRAVILTVPAPVAATIASSVLSQEQKEILGKIPYATFAVANFFSDVPVWDKAFDLASPDDFYFTDVYDSTWLERYYDSSLRKEKEFIIGVYVSEKSYKEKTLLTLSDEDIVKNIYKDLEKMFPGVQKKITSYVVHRHPYAYPVMVPGTYRALMRLHEITKGNLLLAGDYTIYPTFEAAVTSGKLAADKVRAILK